MFNFSTRTTGILLVFGIFFTLSCATFSTTTKNAETLYQESNYSQALAAVNREISDQPDKPEKKILKANILKDYAVNDHAPSDREVVYQNLRNTVEEIQFSSGQFNAVTDSILTSAWMHEQSEGVRYLQQDDSENLNRYFDLVISHFNNAITIIPDSVVTYNLKATTHYRHGDLGDAIATLESIEESGITRPPETCEKLAFLYLEAGMIDRSIAIYEGLTANHPQNEMFRRGLVNAYILGEDHEDSVRLLEALAEEYPNRVEYREALATERFYLLRSEADKRLSEPQTDPINIESYVTSLSEIATIFRDVDTTLPSSEERKERIAEFHLNAANLLQEIADFAGDGSNNRELASVEAESHLRDSIPYLISLFESQSENVAYGRRLLRVYNELNMEQEAESLERQITL